MKRFMIYSIFGIILLAFASAQFGYNNENRPILNLNSAVGGGGSSSNTTIIVSQTEDIVGINWFKLSGAGADTYYDNGGGGGSVNLGYKATHDGWLTGLVHSTTTTGTTPSNVTITAMINGNPTLTIKTAFPSTESTGSNYTDVGLYPFNEGDLIGVFLDTPLIFAITLDSGAGVEVVYNVTN